MAIAMDETVLVQPKKTKEHERQYLAERAMKTNEFIPPGTTIGVIQRPKVVQRTYRLKESSFKGGVQRIHHTKSTVLKAHYLKSTRGCLKDSIVQRTHHLKEIIQRHHCPKNLKVVQRTYSSDQYLGSSKDTIVQTEPSCVYDASGNLDLISLLRLGHLKQSSTSSTFIFQSKNSYASPNPTNAFQELKKRVTRTPSFRHLTERFLLRSCVMLLTWQALTLMRPKSRRGNGEPGPSETEAIILHRSHFGQPRWINRIRLGLGESPPTFKVRRKPKVDKAGLRNKDPGHLAPREDPMVQRLVKRVIQLSITKWNLRHQYEDTASSRSKQSEPYDPPKRKDKLLMKLCKHTRGPTAFSKARSSPIPAKEYAMSAITYKRGREFRENVPRSSVGSNEHRPGDCQD
ncbi:hypothetical protein CR513_46813, partial [Mucuna pruriens]